MNSNKKIKERNPSPRITEVGTANHPIMTREMNNTTSPTVKPMYCTLCRRSRSCSSSLAHPLPPPVIIVDLELQQLGFLT